MICKNCGNDVIPKMSPVQILIGVVLVSSLLFLLFFISFFATRKLVQTAEEMYIVKKAN